MQNALQTNLASKDLAGHLFAPFLPSRMARWMPWCCSVGSSPLFASPEAYYLVFSSISSDPFVAGLRGNADEINLGLQSLVEDCALLLRRTTEGRAHHTMDNRLTQAMVVIDHTGFVSVGSWWNIPHVIC